MMGRQGVVQIIKQEIMEEISGSRCLQKNPNTTFSKKEEMDAVSSAVISTTAVNPISPSSAQLLPFKGQSEESMLRRVDPADDLQLMCTKKCIPCHRCGSSMKFFMRRVKYLNTVKEYPAYRCMKKKCQTFRSPRTLARECNMLLRQGFGDGRFMSVAPTTNATRQLKEAFPDHFNKQEMDGLQGFPTTFRDDFDAFSNNSTPLANSAVSSVIREKEAWYALRNAKQSLDILAHTDGGLSLRLHRIISEIHALATQLKEISKKEVMECSSGLMETDGMHEMDDEGYESMRRSTATDLMSLTLGGDSRSSFENELKSETSSIDSCVLMKMPSSTSTLSPSVTPVQPLRWINISRHSPSFGVKMVDGIGSAARQTVDQRKHTVIEQHANTIYESFSNCPNGNISNPLESTIISRTNGTSSSLLPNIMYDQPSTSYNYGTATSVTVNTVTESNSQLDTNNSSEGKNEPIPIYVRPSELCFDDVADSGEILSEFFMPSTTSNFQPPKSTTTSSTTPTSPV
uniref:DM domain-containing protein n=1 Tax=Elaeophora elaphi TaxID=1147741 RepID=A0A0R3RT45_9BILA